MADSEIDALREEVARLREELRVAREGGRFTMRGETRCPACGCRKILHARRILDRTDGPGQPMSLAEVTTSVWSDAKAVARLQAFVCTDCGLMEWYVSDLGELPVDEKRFTLVQPAKPGDGGPYR